MKAGDTADRVQVLPNDTFAESDTTPNFATRPFFFAANCFQQTTQILRCLAVNPDLPETQRGKEKNIAGPGGIIGKHFLLKTVQPLFDKWCEMEFRVNFFLGHAKA